MEKLMFTVVAALLTGLGFSATCFIIGLVFPFFMWLAGKLFFLGLIIGALHGLTSDFSESN